MTKYRVRMIVKEVCGSCALGYKVGDEILLREYYLLEGQACKVCLHALVGMSTLLIPFMDGVSAKVLGIGGRDDVGYLQCPDPGKPYTDGGTVVFELRRESNN